MFKPGDVVMVQGMGPKFRDRYGCIFTVVEQRGPYSKYLWLRSVASGRRALIHESFLKGANHD